VFEHGNSYLPALLVYPTSLSGWNHIAVVYTNKQPKLYLNGQLVRTGLTSTKLVTSSRYIGDAFGYGPYQGRIDDVMIFEESLSADQVRMIYENRTDLILSNETGLSDVWSAKVYPNDGDYEAPVLTSNNLTILSTPPAVTSVFLNSSTLQNDTDDNASAYAVNLTDVDGQDVNATFNWLLNGTSITVLNMPMTAPIENASGNFTVDVSGYENDGKMV